jgi:hypothetical protein
LARGPLLPSSARFRPVSAGLRATSNNQNGSSLNSNVPPEQLFFQWGAGFSNSIWAKLWKWMIPKKESRNSQRRWWLPWF